MLITSDNCRSDFGKIIDYLIDKEKIDLKKTKTVIWQNAEFEESDAEFLRKFDNPIIISDKKPEINSNFRFFPKDKVTGKRAAEIPKEQSKIEIYKITRNMLSPGLKKTLNILLNLVLFGNLNPGEKILVISGEKDFIDSAFEIKTGKCKLFSDFSVLRTFCRPYIN
ncbi:MAG: hypothetical protein CSB55_07595 [Candidatus Cloacimonadota bacterium]|nr:MAG: hypothetical protein CSB55_07595 [Candidatus Cloacimonadota bacterium]